MNKGVALQPRLICNIWKNAVPDNTSCPLVRKRPCLLLHEAQLSSSHNNKSLAGQDLPSVAIIE